MENRDPPNQGPFIDIMINMGSVVEVEHGESQKRGKVGRGVGFAVFGVIHRWVLVDGD